MLSKQQQETYQYIYQYYLRNHCSPTIREITRGLGLRSLGITHRHLRSLENIGLISISPRKKRGINILDNNHTAYGQLPILGKVGDDQNVSILSNDINLDLREVFLDERFYVFHVIETNAHLPSFIRANDYVLCEKRDYGVADTVIAEINSEQTIIAKIQQQLEEMLILKPMHNDESIGPIALNQINIFGLYAGIIRLG